MHGHAVINLHAGTVLALSADEVARQVREGFAAAGHAIDVRLVTPDRLGAVLDAVAGMDGDVLLVGGGDGTLRGAAQRLAGGRKALGVLPLGTMNRYARDLNIPLDLTAAVAALAAGEIHSVDVGELNGQVFLCNSTLGLPARYSRQRQRLRGRDAGERALGYWRTVRAVLRARHWLALAIDDGHDARRLRVLSLAISNNAYAEQASLMLTRPRLDGGELGVYVSRHRSGLRMAWALLRVMFGRWHGDPYLDAGTARQVTIDAKRPLRVVNDGELDFVHPPLVYRTRPGALRVLRPAAAA